MEEIKPLEVIKRGETSLNVTLVRSAGGLTVYVKAHPAIEAFVRGLGAGDVSDVRASGPYWRPAGTEGKPLMIYTMTEQVPNVILDDGSPVTISRPGQPLLGNNPDEGRIGQGNGRQMVNLSFLRLVGISEGAGLIFNVRGVHTYEAVNRMREYIGEGYRKFYKQYMKPVKMDIVVSTQETSL